MRVFEKTITSPLTQRQILSYLKSSTQFKGIIDNTKFSIRESILMTSTGFFPVINGLIDEQNGCSQVVVVFELSKCDKVASGIFLFITSILSLLLGFVSSDILLTVVILCFVIFVIILFFLYYVHNCQRAYKKLFRLLNSQTLN